MLLIAYRRFGTTHRYNFQAKISIEDGTRWVVPKRRQGITIIKCVVIHKSADLILVPIEFGEYVMKFNESVYDTVVYRQGWLYLL